jgi:uncharacterized protein (DUF1697 family)
MTTHIGLLRAVNLPGYQKVGMADLRELAVNLGLKGAQTLLASGNLLFRSDVRATSRLERLLEEGSKKRLGLETDFFVRSSDDWKTVIAGNTFRKEAREDPGHLLVLFLKETPDGESVSSLRRAITGREMFQARGRELYVVYPDGVGRSRLTTALIERKLGTRATGRNWNTVVKLATLAEAL